LLHKHCFVYVTISQSVLRHSVSQSQEPVRNDVALLLHLVTATKRKMVPYFTVFLFDQWNDKLQQSGWCD